MKINVQANASFKEVDHSKKRYIVMKGSAGSGKSMDTAQHYILRLMNDPGRNLLCVRKADVTNRDSTFAELQGAIFRMFGESYKRYWYINSSNMLLECKRNYNQIIFGVVNDEKQREKLKTITFKRGKLTDVWIEEATEITQSDFEIIDDRLRGELPEGQFYQIRMTFNPVSAHHWIKKVFFDRTDPDVLTHQSTYENNRFIDEAYHRRMLRRKEVDPEGYRVYGLGEWGEVAGLILKNYVIEEFDRIPGKDQIAVFHINDSKNPCGAHKDRHENLGKGYIGFDALSYIVHHPDFTDVPKILETPWIPIDGDKKNTRAPYKEEIALLRGDS